MLNASVFIATSLDGFIARADGAIDWLPHTSGEDHGYDAFMAEVDALVMGRTTFETVLGFGSWPFGPKPVFVLSTRPLTLPMDAEAVIERLNGSPAEIVSQLEQRGFRSLYVDGGRTIQGFLAAGLIQRLILTRVPVLLGSGIPLFGPLLHDVWLEHRTTRAFPSGLIQSEYAVLPARGR